MQNYILLIYCGQTLKNKIYMRLLLVIKKENVDLEKQVNKLNNFLVLHKSIKLVLTLLIFGSISQIKAQERVPFDQGKKYILADVAVIGKISFNAQTVVTFAGLEKGKEITVPGEEISNAIKKGFIFLFQSFAQRLCDRPAPPLRRLQSPSPAI